MELSGLHLLLTYQCTFECDHCFVWGSPFQSGTMTLEKVRHILEQAKEVGTVEWIFFEGGEPFLYYPVLLKCVQEAAAQGFRVGIVSNTYWATQEEDAIEWLRPFVGLVEDLSISSDLFHYSEEVSQQTRNATAAAKKLGLPLGVMSVAQPEATNAACAVGQLPTGGAAVMYRGRAAVNLTPRATYHPWTQFTSCPYEDLRDPGRVHVDPLGYLHICQGIVIGNMFQTPLRTILQQYNPDVHPITGALLAGGPVELVERYHLAHQESYADACHLCYTARQDLRSEFPQLLTPDQMYGILDN